MYKGRIQLGVSKSLFVLVPSLRAGRDGVKQATRAHYVTSVSHKSPRVLPTCL